MILTCQDYVTVYHADGLEPLPAVEKGSWDLVVGNPPHFVDDDKITFGGNTLREYDWGWQLHVRVHGMWSRQMMYTNDI